MEAEYDEDVLEVVGSLVRVDAFLQEEDNLSQEQRDAVEACGSYIASRRWSTLRGCAADPGPEAFRKVFAERSDSWRLKNWVRAVEEVAGLCPAEQSSV